MFSNAREKKREIFLTTLQKETLLLNFVLLLMSKQIAQLIRALSSQFRDWNFPEAFVLTLFTVSSMYEDTPIINYDNSQINFFSPIQMVFL